MTDKIYQRQPYLKEYESEIVSFDGKNLVLSSTIFAPEAGGQPCDLGTIGGYRVKYVGEENGVVYHELSVPEQEAAEDEKNVKDPQGAQGGTKIGLQPGMNISMQLDWERRFDHMQNHLGEHMLSGLFKSEYDADNKGFHMGDEIACFDIDLKEITPQMLRNIEHKANRAVYAALPVKVSFAQNAEQAAEFPLRKPPAVDEDILIVTVEGVDCCACCCPHPSNTSQVGIVKLLRTEKYKGMTRVYFKCGMRALLDYEQKHDVVSELSEKYSADEFSLLEKERIAESKHEEIRRELNRMKDKFAELSARELLEGAQRAVIHEFEAEDIDGLKRIAKKVTAKTDLPVILSSENHLCVFMTHTGKSGLRCGTVVKEFAVGAGGKGGGSDTQAQAIFTNADLMRNFVRLAEAHLS